jgi:TolB-like protein/tetratricopeptide (TPR) repeat protein
MRTGRKIRLRIYGTFSACWEGSEEIDIRSEKTRALLAILALSPEGKKQRGSLQELLWGLSGPELGRASLRRALSDLRKAFGEEFNDVFITSQSYVQLCPDRWEIAGGPADGNLLEGTGLQEPGLREWLGRMREPGLVPASFRPSPLDQPATRASVRPSIAVIPFQLVSGTEDHARLGDLVAQEISRALSRSKLIDVISHLSCRNLDARSLELSEIRQLLGIDYIVYGNYRTDGRSVRLDVDFVSAASGHILWTRTHEGTIEELCRGDTDAIFSIARQAGSAIVNSSLELAASTPLPNVASHALFISSVALMHRQDLPSFSSARAQLEELVQRAPRLSFLHAWLAQWYVLSIQQGWSSDLAKDTMIASDLTRRALDLNPNCSFSLTIDGFVENNLRKRFDISTERFDQALDIDPNNAYAWLLKGTLHAFMDEGEKAVQLTQHARRLSPLDPQKYFFDSLAATACLSNQDFETALRLAELSISQNKYHTSTLRVRTIALQSMGETAKAAESARELLEREPNLTIGTYLDKHPAARFQTGKDWAKALKGAGVPDN